MVYSIVYTILFLPFAIAIWCFVDKFTGAGVFWILVWVVFMIVYYFYRKAIERLVEFFRAASAGLLANAALLPALICVFVVKFAVLAVLIFFIYSASGVGSPALRGGFDYWYQDGGIFCLKSEGSSGKYRETACCEFEVASWANDYINANILILIWTALMFVELATYIIGKPQCACYPLPRSLTTTSHTRRRYDRRLVL